MVRFLRPRWETVVPATVILLAVGSVRPAASAVESCVVRTGSRTEQGRCWSVSRGAQGRARWVSPAPRRGSPEDPKPWLCRPTGASRCSTRSTIACCFSTSKAAPSASWTCRLAQPRFLAVDDDALYVLDVDADHKLAMYTWAGERTGLVSLPPLGDVVTGLFATSEGACVEVAHRTTLLLGHPEELVLAANARTIAPQALRKVDGRPLNRDLRQAARTTYRPKDGVKIHALKIRRCESTDYGC